MNLQLPLLLGHKSNVLFESFVAAHGISETEHLTTKKWLDLQGKLPTKFCNKYPTQLVAISGIIMIPIR